ncbi:YcnI family protein [Mycobacterium sp. CVI_P3]|uniref:YcnI family protein n=1 Tax=Mycobacterium pinniadriaticum TaxID=2994102 RepID=A0ABT3SK71_9MYCO|nr:YcnI family protein [Mycobacterium pinniadriaticum]MCX2933465.1 YcnI family protein [Mycobacterium pinniadriaticum]MCX2939896.1 YcnI family protein [Mycobacterium pinniadriaticum]
MTRRRLVTRALTTAALTGTLILGSAAPTAGAHVHVDADHPVRGGTALVTFQVPNESETGSPTTRVTISLPNVASARTDVMAGWTAALNRDASTGMYRSVTFTATPDAGIGAGQFELFAMSIQLPDADSATFPVVQTYADGTVVHWDQPPLPSGGEPDYPAPVLELTAGPHAPEERHKTPAAPAPTTTASVSAAPTAGEHAEPQAGPDNTARALAGSALLVAAIGVGVAVARRRT